MQTTKVDNNPGSQNGSFKKTNVVVSENGKDLVERTEVVKTSSSSSNGAVRVPKTEVVRGANSNDIVERTQFVKPTEMGDGPVSWDEINGIVQGLNGLTQYLPLLAVIPEVCFLFT